MTKIIWQKYWTSSKTYASFNHFDADNRIVYGLELKHVTYITMCVGSIEGIFLQAILKISKRRRLQNFSIFLKICFLVISSPIIDEHYQH